MTTETYRDPWGIPHLRALTPLTLAHAQGRTTALDRPWQLELERHRAQGTSAAFLGPDALPWDTFARRARLLDTARRCFERLEETDPETAEWVRAYVAGVNEGLGVTGEKGAGALRGTPGGGGARGAGASGGVSRGEVARGAGASKDAGVSESAGISEGAAGGEGARGVGVSRGVPGGGDVRDAAASGGAAGGEVAQGAGASESVVRGGAARGVEVSRGVVGGEAGRGAETTPLAAGPRTASAPADPLTAPTPAEPPRAAAEFERTGADQAYAGPSYTAGFEGAGSVLDAVGSLRTSVEPQSAGPAAEFAAAVQAPAEPACGAAELGRAGVDQVCAGSSYAAGFEGVGSVPDAVGSLRTSVEPQSAGPAAEFAAAVPASVDPSRPAPGFTAASLTLAESPHPVRESERVDAIPAPAGSSCSAEPQGTGLVTEFAAAVPAPAEPRHPTPEFDSAASPAVDSSCPTAEFERVDPAPAPGRSRYPAAESAATQTPAEPPHPARESERVDATPASAEPSHPTPESDGIALPAADSPYPAPEFERVGLVPGAWEPWTPLAIWLSVHILFAGFPAKLWREEAIRWLGEGAVGLFAADGPATSGSNGWVLDGSRTVSGSALIAGDPHRFIEDPGIYQQIRLACDEFDVVGLAVPGVPGIAHFGHTGTVAWAITNAMADYQDVYREKLRRTGAGVEALDADGVWRRVSRHTELIEVAGETPVEIEVLETPRGPVIAGGPEGLDDATPLALSLRYPPRVTGELGFSTLLKLLRATTVADVDAALDDWCEPVNVVQAADTAGGTLHRVAGKVPVRAEANRVRVVPAWEPGHDWTGWHEMPSAELTDGAAVMANQRGPARELGVEFAPPHRADRIRTLLQERRKWTPEALTAIHMDTRLASAEPLLTTLAALKDLTAPADTLRTQLLRWNRHMDATSTTAASYASLRGEVVRRLAAHPAFANLTTPPAYPDVLLPWLALTPRIGFALEHLLRAEELYGIDRESVVREALEDIATRPRRTWGDTHRLTPWRALPDDTFDPPPLSGDHDCVLCTTAIPGVTDRAARGPAARYVWDLADRQQSRWIVPDGAQLPLWLRGDTVPVTTDWNSLRKEHDVRP